MATAGDGDASEGDREAEGGTATEAAGVQSEDESGDTDPSLPRRVWDRVRSIEPFYFGLLGLLSFLDQLHEALAFTQLFAVFFLAFLWPFVGPLLGMLRSSDEAEAHPRDWLRSDDETREHLTFLAMVPVTVLNPPLMVQDLWQALGGFAAAVRHGGSVPTAESYEQQVEYRLPFEGTWTVVNGSPVREHSHSWFYVNQRYAYDFVQTDESGRSRPEGAPPRVGEYYAYGEPMLAPAAGTVVDAYDASPESGRAGGFSHPLKGDIRGNYVVIQHAPEEYSSLVHLQPGSVTVEPGEVVERGQQVGRCGHSGNSSEPHLHFQVQDHPNWMLAASLPIAFEDVEVEWPGDPDTAPDVPAGHEGLPAFTDEGVHDRAFVTVGQRVTPRSAAADREQVAEEVQPSEETNVTTLDETGPGHDGSTDEDGVSAERPGSKALQAVCDGGAHLGFGLGIGGAVAFFGALLATAQTITAVLLVGAVVALGYALRAVVSSGPNRHAAVRFLGTAAGVAIAAAIVSPTSGLPPSVDVDPRTFGPALFAGGLVLHLVLGEFDRWHLARSASPTT